MTPEPLAPEPLTPREQICGWIRDHLASSPAGAVATIPAAQIHTVFGEAAGAVIAAQAERFGLSVEVSQSPPWTYAFRLKPRGSN